MIKMADGKVLSERNAAQSGLMLQVLELLLDGA